MTLSLIIYLSLAVAALLVLAGSAAWFLRRRDVLRRATSETTAGPRTVLRPDKAQASRIKERLEQFAQLRKEDQAIQSKLVQAGYDSGTAGATYFLLRISCLVVIPVLAVAIAPRTRLVLWILSMLVAVFAAFILPAALLDRAVRLRQERIRRSVPDALDLLVVCVEAGVSLDAAILRVAREIRNAHPDLADELAVVNRVTNAGLPREAALRGLWQRTGVEDLRALVSSMIQSEKWGTSIATVLRVAADTLRRKRRQLAEKKAKMAPLKMTFPLLFFILPALFTVIWGRRRSRSFASSQRSRRSLSA
ncbi:MAG: type II secretion system F family protein [Gemmatimonadaceae bacterium]